MSDLHIDSNNFGKDEVKTLLTLIEQKKFNTSILQEILRMVMKRDLKNF